MRFNEQDEDMQARVRTLVANGQLDFVNGGWCMHDEAAAHYIAMVDQTTLGHQAGIPNISIPHYFNAYSLSLSLPLII